MKKKIFIVLFCLMTIMLLATSKKVFATNVNEKFYSYTVPNKYELYYNSVTDTSSYKSYRGYNGDNRIYLTFSCYKSSYVKPYTTTDLNDRIDILKKVYDDSEGESITFIHKGLIELNGVKGYRVTYYVKYSDSKTIYRYDEYSLRSDNNTYKVAIDEYAYDTTRTYIDSTEAKNIVNSFKVKDTVKQTNNIPFNDVTSKNWCYNAVKYTYDKNMINGLNNYTFGPNEKLTRGMLVTILWRMEGQPKTTANKFTDVKSGKYYYTAVNWAASKKIVNGYGNGKFGPNDNITREQLCAILMNYAKYKNKNTTARADITKFKDKNKISSYFKDSVSWCVAKKIISGKSNGTLVDPKGKATRAEAASMLMSYCTNVK